MKKTISVFFALALAATPVAVFAEGVNLGVAATAPGVGASVKVTAEQNAKARASQEIDRRVSNLSQLMAQIGTLKRLSDSQKTQFYTGLNEQVTELSALKVKIDADTDVATLKPDVQSITKSYRIYALVIPQSRIAVSADRVLSIVAQMQALGTKLQSRMGVSTSTDAAAMQSAYADMQAKLTDATTQANAAVTATASLTPDKGDSVVATANTSALKAARAQIEVATKDLKAARDDVQTILKGLKVSATASASAQTE